MGIVVVQESEERPFRLPAPSQPIEKLTIDHGRIFTIGVDQQPKSLHWRSQEVDVQPIFEETLNPLDPLYGPIHQPSRLEGGKPRNNVVLVTSEASLQAGVGSTIPIVADKTGRGVAARTQ